MPLKHYEHPALHYGEPIAVAVVILVGLSWLSYRVYAYDDRSAPTIHPPTVIQHAPFQEGDVIEAETVRRILPWWEVKTGEKVLLKRRLPYEGALPEQASYELYTGQ